jgi:metal-responsive CopG/Arc/MetJ family transcriptional regulator
MTLHVELPEPLASQIENVYQKEGYATKSGFVRDAARRRLDELKE